jgi:hypothetical protein
MILLLDRLLRRLIHRPLALVRLLHTRGAAGRCSVSVSGGLGAGQSHGFKFGATLREGLFWCPSPTASGAPWLKRLRGDSLAGRLGSKRRRQRRGCRHPPLRTAQSSRPLVCSRWVLVPELYCSGRSHRASCSDALLAAGRERGTMAPREFATAVWVPDLSPHHPPIHHGDIAWCSAAGAGFNGETVVVDHDCESRKVYTSCLMFELLASSQLATF